MIMPTDGLFDLVAIKSVRVVPRKVGFTEAAGREFIPKRDEYRNTMYVHSPSTITYEVRVPKGGELHVGMGITEKGIPVTFRVSADSKELRSTLVSDFDVWVDPIPPLPPYAGRGVKLAFETSAQKEGSVAFWANPLPTTKVPKKRPNVLIYLVATERAD